MTQSKKIISTYTNNAEKVRAFYNQNTDNFIAVYGEIIQAFRTTNVSDYLDYTIKSAKLKPGERLLDAGCGVCGPAVYFAKHVSNIQIEACTVSDTQAEKGESNINANNLADTVRVTRADYHNIASVYGKEQFDVVYFLESFGHSTQKNVLIDACWDVLKPGGRVYIKDLFKRISDDEWEQLRINQICKDIDDGYQYDIANLSDVLDKIRSKGFILSFVKVPEVDLSQFEHLTISNDFQNLFNIAKIDSWDDYIFPIDFYEILAIKPAVNNLDNMHLYFMNK
jgi:cyclopropane fatty-acyl-phospholipid synthase-like methyltransferase